MQTCNRGPVGGREGGYGESAEPTFTWVTVCDQEYARPCACKA